MVLNNTKQGGSKMKKANGIKKAQVLVNSSMKIFQKAVEGIEKANDILMDTVNDSIQKISNHKEKIEDLESVKEVANASIESNNALKADLQKFVK